jgi:cytochrome c oxidase subunit 3/cytochrome c oxidase subunit I+III
MNAEVAAILNPPRYDESRGSHTMSWLIVTEAMLFVSMFFAYFMLGSMNAHWPMDPPPKLKLALWMLAVLLVSSGVLEIARHLRKRGHGALSRVATVVAALMGVGFLVIQSAEYKERLKVVTPTTDAYGSIFYTITSIHGLHVLFGVLALLFVACLPHPGPGAARPPHRALHAATLYWHFVDGVWLVIVGLLYLLPHWRAAS